MALAAAQVVDAIAAALVVAPTALAGRVHTDRAWPFPDTDLPQANVVITDEEIENETIHYPALERHTLTTKIRGRVRAVADLDDAMNDFAADVLGRLYPSSAGSTLNGLVKRMRTVSIDRDNQHTGEASIGAVDITVETVFYTSNDDPHTII